MTTSIRNPRPESKADARGRKPATEFETQWREPDRTLVDYVAAAWSRKLWIGISALALGAIAFVYALTRPNVYASHASLLVIGNRSGASAAEVAANMLRMGNIGPSQVLSALEIVNSSEVAERVVAKATPAEITRPTKVPPCCFATAETTSSSRCTLCRCPSAGMPSSRAGNRTVASRRTGSSATGAAPAAPRSTK